MLFRDRRRRVCCLLVALGAILGGAVDAAETAEISVVTEDLPPYSFMAGGRLGGLSSDIVRAAFERSGVRVKISLLPWARAYKMVLGNEAACIYSTARTPERESLFKWIGPLVHDNWVAFAKQSSGAKIVAPTDLARLRTATPPLDATADILRRLGVEPEQVSTSDLLKLLDGNRIDFWLTSRMRGQYQSAIAKTALKELITLEGFEFWLACNPSVSEELIARLNRILAEMEADGTYGRLGLSYHFVPSPYAPVVGPADSYADIVMTDEFTGSDIYGTKDYMDGIIQAVRDLSAQGPLLGKNLRARFQDQPELYSDAAAGAAAEVSQTSLVVGGFSSTSVSQWSPFYARRGVIQITPGATNPALTEQGFKTLFRTIGRDDGQALVVAGALGRLPPGARIVIVTDTGLFGQGMSEAVITHLQRAGRAPILMTEKLSTSNGASPALLESLARARPDFVFVAAGSQPSGLFLGQMRKYGLKAPVIGGDPLGTGDFPEFAGTAAEGVLFVAPAPPPVTPRTERLARQLIAAGGSPTPYFYMTYATVEAWYEAVRRAGSFENNKVADALHRGVFDTVLGQISFDDHGDIVAAANNWQVFSWRRGKVVAWDGKQMFDISRDKEKRR